MISEEKTYQQVVSFLKFEQNNGLHLANGERFLKESAAPSSARLLEKNALKQFKKVYELDCVDRSKIIFQAATDYEKKIGKKLDEFTISDFSSDELKRLDSYVFDEYCESLINTGELTSSEASFILSDKKEVYHAIVTSDSYVEYRNSFWNDVKFSKHSWIIFNRFKVFLKQYWGNVV